MPNSSNDVSMLPSNATIHKMNPGCQSYKMYNYECKYLKQVNSIKNENRYDASNTTTSRKITK